MQDSNMAEPFDYNLLDFGCIETSVMSGPRRLNQITHIVRVRNMYEFVEANDAMAFSHKLF
jgi:hypothetical protein